MIKRKYRVRSQNAYGSFRRIPIGSTVKKRLTASLTINFDNRNIYIFNTCCVKIKFKSCLINNVWRDNRLSKKKNVKRDKTFLCKSKIRFQPILISFFKAGYSDNERVLERPNIDLYCTATKLEKFLNVLTQTV